ncbi:MAG: hypothetical protein QOE33_468 [Acidobacteriota bacterium]|nr:hypothetical protein [Acidobacteriota bacterium]
MESRTVLSTTPWAIPAKFEHLVPALLSPVSNTLEQLESHIQGWDKYGDTSQPESEKSPTALDALQDVTISGGPDVTDIVGALTLSLLNGQETDLTLEFLSGPAKGRSLKYDISNRAGLPILEAASSPQLSKGQPRVLGTGNPPPWNWEFKRGWRVQFRGLDEHNLGSCVPEPVKHFNIEFTHNEPAGSNRWSTKVNLHLGKYRRTCFVAFDSEHSWFCLKNCDMSKAGLKKIFTEVLKLAAAAAGVTFAAWELAVISEGLADILYIPAFLLL